MGTTVTTNLGLIKPDVDESIREDLPTFPGWASQNEDNCDKIDSLFRKNGTTYTLNWTGSGSNPVLGAAGFTEGKFVRLFPRMVFVTFRIFTGGAGFTVGSGTYRINLPATLDPDLVAYGGEALPLGRCMFQDSSAALTSSSFLMSYLASSNLVVARPSAGVVWTDTNPVVLGQNDRISGYLLYPTTDA